MELKTRKVNFPEDVCIGNLYVANTDKLLDWFRFRTETIVGEGKYSQVNHWEWNHAGVALGTRQLAMAPDDALILRMGQVKTSMSCAVEPDIVDIVCEIESAQQLEWLSNNLYRVKGLIFSNSALLDQTDLRHFKNFSELQYLVLPSRVTRWLHAPGMEFIFDHKNLSLLSMPYNPLIRLAARIPELTELETLAISYCDENSYGASNAELFKSVSALQNLRHLSNCTDKAFASRLEDISKLSQLESLDLRRTNVTNENIGYLSKLSRLKRLNLQNGVLSEKSLAVICDLTELEEFVLPRLILSDSLTRYLRHLPQLKKLVVSGSFVNSSDKLETLDLCKRLAALSNLESLMLTTVVSNPKALAELPKLAELRLRYCGLVDDSLKGFSDFPCLRKLDISHNELTDSGLQHLLGLPLEELNLSQNINITPNGIASLKQIPTLKKLGLRATVGLALSNERLQAVAQIPSLNVVEMSDSENWGTRTPPSDLDLNHLAELRRMRFLSLSKVTAVVPGTVPELLKFPNLDALDLPTIVLNGLERSIEDQLAVMSIRQVKPT